MPIVDWQGLIIDLKFSSNYSDAQKVEVNWKSKINNFMNLDCHPTSDLPLNCFKENLSGKMAREWTDEAMVKHTLYLLVCLMVTARNDLKFTKEVCSSFLKEGQKQTYILRDFVRAIELVSTLKLSNKTPKRNKYHQFLKKWYLEILAMFLILKDLFVIRQLRN